MGFCGGGMGEVNFLMGQVGEKAQGIFL